MTTGGMLIWIVLAILSGMYANKLNRSGFGYFLLSFIGTPVLGFAILLVLGENKDIKKTLSNWKDFPKDTQQQEQKTNIDNLVKLSELLEKGRITKEEFEIEKSKIFVTPHITVDKIEEPYKMSISTKLYGLFLVFFIVIVILMSKGKI